MKREFTPEEKAALLARFKGKHKAKVLSDEERASSLARSREVWNETRRTRAAKVPESFEGLSLPGRAVLDLACLEGRVLIGGPRMSAYLNAAKLLVRKGLLLREDGTSFFAPTPAGLALYGKRQSIL